MPDNQNDKQPNYRRLLNMQCQRYPNNRIRPYLLRGQEMRCHPGRISRLHKMARMSSIRRRSKCHQLPATR